MGMTIDTIIKDCEQSIIQDELFIKVHQKNMEIGEIKEYQYYIERDKLTIDVMRKYQKIQEIFYMYDKGELTHHMFGLFVGEVLEDGRN